MAEPATFSFSRVTAFEQCARRYRYRYVDGVREAFQSIEGFMGQQVHAAIEWLFQERDAGRSPRVEDAVGYYLGGFDRGHAEAGGTLKVIKRETVVEDYRRSGAQMLADYHKTRFVVDRLETVGLEQHFEMDLGSGPRFQGFIDRLARDEVGTLHIIDYKTGGRPPIQFGGKDGDQLEVYAMVMFAQTDAEELELVLEYLKNGSTLTRRVRRSESLEKKRMLQERIKFAAEANVFPATPGGLCGWCGFNDLCEEGARSLSRWRSR